MAPRERTLESPPPAFSMLFASRFVRRRLSGVICFDVLVFSAETARCRTVAPHDQSCLICVVDAAEVVSSDDARQCGNPAFNIRKVHAFRFTVNRSVSDAVAILGTADLAI